MAVDPATLGAKELRFARKLNRPLYWSVALFSLLVNMLMLTGPLYMLNVYDRVLGSRSLETLVALTVLVGFMFGMMGILDLVRGRVMGRAAARFQARLDRRVFSAAIRGTGHPTVANEAATGQRDLESVQRLIGMGIPTEIALGHVLSAFLSVEPSQTLDLSKKLPKAACERLGDVVEAVGGLLSPERPAVTKLSQAEERPWSCPRLHPATGV